MPRRILRSRANQLAHEPESLVTIALGQARGQFPGNELRIDRGCGLMCPSVQRLPPFRDVIFDSLAPRAVAPGFQSRQQCAQCLGGVADEANLHGKADRQHAGVDVDLHAARGAFLGQEFGVREGGADHQQRVALHHHVVAGLGAEQADRAGDPWQIVGQHGLAEQRLGTARRQPVGDGDHLVGGTKRAGADEHRNLLAGIEHLRGAIEIGLARRDAGCAVADAGMQRAVGVGRAFVRFLLQVVGQDDHGRGPPRQRDPDRAVDQVPHLGRRGCLHDIGARDVLEHREKVELLLVVPAEGIAGLLAHDRQHRLVIEQRIVEPGDKVRGTGSGRRDADPELA